MVSQLLALIGVALVGTAFAIIVTLRRIRAEEFTQQSQLSIPVLNTIQLMPDDPVDDLDTPLVTDELDWLALAVDELQTPFASLYGYTLYLRQNVEHAPRSTLLVLTNRLIAQVERLSGTIDAWNISAKTGSTQKNPEARPIELLGLAHIICARLTMYDEPPCDIADGPPVWILANPAIFDQAFAIVVRNARRAAPHSMIEVVIRTVEQSSQGRVCIAVADRRSQPQGAVPPRWEALELELVRTLIEQLGGWLTTEDRARGGTITTLWLPAQCIIPVPPPQSISPPITPDVLNMTGKNAVA
jgi:signal transduction histidine kinase